MPNYVTNTIKMIGSDKDFQAISELLRNKNPDVNEGVCFNNVIPMPQSLEIVAGGHDTDYVAAYVKTLSEADAGRLAKRLADIPGGFYSSYLKKYIDAFIRRELPASSLEWMQEKFKEDYKAINPATIEDVGKAYIDNILNYGADTWYDWKRKNWGTKWDAMNSVVDGNTIRFETANSSPLPVTSRLSQMFPDVVFAHEWADEDIGSNCGRCVMKAGEMIEEYLPEGEEAVAFACNMWGCDASEYCSPDQSFIPLDDVISSCEKMSKAETPSIVQEKDDVVR